MYEFREFYIRDQMLGAIKRYIENKLEPGSFLTAIICNDLKGAVQSAVQSADEENLKNIPAFVSYFYNEAPSTCWGSIELMENWLKK